MCLPPDVSTPALPPLGRRRDVNPSTWSPDTRANLNWSAPPPQQPAGSTWSSWAEVFNIPQSGFNKEDACSSNVIDVAPLGSLLASALEQQEVPKTWQPQANWSVPQNNSFYCGSQPIHSSYGGGIDAFIQSGQGSISDMALSPSPKSMMKVQETLSSIAPHGVDALERPKEEHKSRIDSLFEELCQEGRSGQETAAEKFCNPIVKTAKIACQKTKQATRPGVKKESVSPKDMCTGESDIDISDDEGEGAPVISEKRRKRMLSNRASAQRSRQRRQERLDTLEVLVAQLRVENAALKTKASNAASSLKKLEDENKILRERLDAKEQNRHCEVSLRKDGTGNECLQTSDDNTNMSGVENSEDGVKTPMGDSDSFSENTDPNKRQADVSTANTINNVNADSNFRTTNQPSKKKRSCEDTLEKDWSFNPNFSTVFNGQNIEPVENSTGKTTKHKSAARVGTMTDYTQEYESMKCLTSLPQIPGFTQEMEAFDIDLEHSPCIDKKLLESVEEIWLDGFSDVCFK